MVDGITITGIKINHDASSLFGSDTSDVDVAATVASYQAAVAAELSVTYPGADIRVVDSGAGYTTVAITVDGGHTPADIWDAEMDAEEMARQSMARVWEGGVFWVLEGEGEEEQG